MGSGGGGGFAGVAGMIEGEVEAVDVLDAITKDRFLVTPHPEVLEYINRKGADRDRWISGMQRLQERYEDWMPEKID